MPIEDDQNIFVGNKVIRLALTAQFGPIFHNMTSRMFNLIITKC